MAKMTGRAHVVKHSRRYKDKVYHSYLLRRSYRVGNKVKKETLANLSHLPEDLIDIIRRYLKGEVFAGAKDVFHIERTLPHGHVAAVLGTLRSRMIEKLLGSKPSRNRSLAVAMIVARIVDPCSKLAIARGLDGETGTNSLGDILKIGSVSADELYAAMDWLVANQPKIEQALVKRHLSEGAVVLYDVTSSYFEGRKCPLAKLGHNRDGKKGKLQIVIGLMCSNDGCPLSVQVFEGNTGDPKTLAGVIEKLRSRFGLKSVVLVGDRGMLTEARLREDIRPVKGIDWITALRGPAIGQLVKSGSLQLSLFDERHLAEITDPEYPGERLIVCRNPLLAEERARKRADLIAATEKDLDKIVQATERAMRALKGADKIALRVGKVINKFKVGKYFEPEITDNQFAYTRIQDRIDEDALLDGLYVIRTSLSPEQSSAEGAVGTYKNLSAVERAFRSMKSIDLKVRPIHHHLADRVKAHVFLCMLAYYVEWHMRKALAPILFDDEDPEAAESLRESTVAPAQRSEGAVAKARSRKTPDGLPITSFQDLLKHLATLGKNTVRVADSPQTYQDFTEPTRLQAKAFDLLKIDHHM